MPTPVGSMGQIQALLAGLGGTADTVAHTLYTLGITGNRDSLRTCPVARYLRTCTGSTSVEVTDSDVTVDLPDGSAVTVFTPSPVAEFIVGFDRHLRYQHLVAAPQLDGADEIASRVDGLLWKVDTPPREDRGGAEPRGSQPMASPGQ